MMTVRQSKVERANEIMTDTNNIGYDDSKEIT